MDSGQNNFLKGCLGVEGLEEIRKSILREGYLIPTDQTSQYLAMLVVPPSLLSWVITITKGMKDGDNKEVEVPGNAGTKLLLNRTKSDIYTGYLHKEGTVLHRFTGLSIPQLAGHMMTVLELYGGIDTKQITADKKIIDSVAPLIDKLIQDRFAAPTPSVQITINTGSAQSPKPAAPGFVTEPPVMKGPPAVEATDESSESSSSESSSVQKEETSESSSSGESVKVLPDGSGVMVGTVKSEVDINALATSIVAKAVKESKPKPFGIILTKNEMEARCPDCGGQEFKNEQFTGCLCMSSMQECKVKVVKNEDGTYRLQFGKRWTSDDLKMFLDIIKRDLNE